MFKVTVIEIGSETVKLQVETAPGEVQTRIMGVGTSCVIEPSDQKLIDHLSSRGVIEHKTVQS